VLLYDLRYMYQNLGILLIGLEKTVEISILSLLVAIVLGLILVIPRMSRHRALNLPAIAYIEVYRNTPLLIQIYLLYFGLPILGIYFSGFVCGVLALALQHAALLAEVFRSGIQAISKRQVEAAKALGMKHAKIMRVVVLPQALVNVIPPVANQLVLLVKDSAVVSVIAVIELTLTGQILSEKTAAPFAIFIAIGLLYLILTTLLSVFLRFLEKNMKIYY
jgi:His/Glu/Gln/Arg/opine family amino acid ABC transporter permease subunit